ncbi:dienelactone hydrolase family protein [Phycicoccus sp. MAQZ13P-2]|uniref:alpha/beta hydrolase n=1 Tax=Phycicoccus mangrovi TaxID=2840470 RepID=UPI001C001D7A|nr:dienelactone hydrolase family protein [Phycicoccus mangrovi]MBT9256298.1 dienelactone hydrolase family protein [Phycicoccus mangrovi]MBT9273706.1 dienelactone hydrolase family protein [Phycicoccus mangrovi]
MITSVASDDGRIRLSAVEYGSGSTAAIFLHQTGAGGLCGWVPYGTWAASQGIHAVLVDDCVHGASVCSEDVIGDPRNAVATAVAWARTQGAERVVVVGASMGGAVALGTAQEAGADAVVDLSGPSRWPGVPDAVAAATATRIPLLLVVAGDDREMGVPALREAVAASPAVTKQFVLAKDGHGWGLTMSGDAPDLMPTVIGRQVLDWVRGKYPAPGAGAAGS